MNTDKYEAMRELALMLAKVKALMNDESVDRFVFDRVLIHELNASEQIEIVVRRIHKRDALPVFELAEVVEPV